MTCNWCQQDVSIPNKDVIVATDDSDDFMIHGKCQCGANVNTVMRNKPVILKELSRVGVGITRRVISMQQYIDTFCVNMELEADLSEKCRQEVYQW